MNTQTDPKDSICPTCHRLMPVAQLAQLNRLLEQIRKESTSNPKRNEWIAEIITEITRVSRRIAPEPERVTMLPKLTERFTELPKLCGYSLTDALTCALVSGHVGPHRNESGKEWQ